MPETTSSIEKAAATLKEGGLVAFPTETVYGLGAVADDDDAVRKVFALKGRPTGHPLIVHLPDVTHLADWASDCPDQAKTLAEKFMPGPLTLVLGRKKDKAQVASGGHGTIALRVPAHPIAQGLLAAAGNALVAPSANCFGRPSPTKAEHVMDDFADTDLLVLDGGTTDLGVESTVVDMTDPERPAILRLGATGKKDIEECLGVKVATGNDGVAAPGNLTRHYSPRQKLVVLGDKKFANCGLGKQDGKIAAYGFARPDGIADGLWLQMSDDPRQAEKNLYADLRKIEKTGATLIAVNEVPKGQAWSVIADRLHRAAAINTQKQSTSNN